LLPIFVRSLINPDLPHNWERSDHSGQRLLWLSVNKLFRFLAISHSVWDFWGRNFFIAFRSTFSWSQDYIEVIWTLFLKDGAIGRRWRYNKELRWVIHLVWKIII
jgi:hypothetical protein